MLSGENWQKTSGEDAFHTCCFSVVVSLCPNFGSPSLSVSPPLSTSPSSTSPSAPFPSNAAGASPHCRAGGGGGAPRGFKHVQTPSKDSPKPTETGETSKHHWKIVWKLRVALLTSCRGPGEPSVLQRQELCKARHSKGPGKQLRSRSRKSGNLWVPKINAACNVWFQWKWSASLGTVARMHSILPGQ